MTREYARDATLLGSRDGISAVDYKVIFFTTGMTAGGAERVIATLANALASRGCDVVIAMVKGEESAYELAPDVRLVSANLAPGLRNLPKAIAFYRNLIRREAPDVVASLSTKSDIIALLAKVLLRIPVRLVVSERADPYTRSRSMQLACNVLYRWSDALVCQSRSVAGYYRRRCRGARPVVIVNPLNLDSVGEAHSGQRAPTVISVGRLSEQKNHRLAIAAFKRIRATHPDLTFKIFGEGPLEVELAELIRAEGLEDSVQLEGVVSNVARKYANASLFLFTSAREGYPNALLEAAATGIPAVTTDFSPGTAHEIIEAEVNGYVVPVGDLNAVVGAAHKALSGELRSEELRAAAERIRDDHQVERVMSSWLAVLRA